MFAKIVLTIAGARQRAPAILFSVQLNKKHPSLLRGCFLKLTR